jgi:hypothetical protein
MEYNKYQDRIKEWGQRRLVERGERLLEEFILYPQLQIMHWDYSFLDGIIHMIWYIINTTT